MTKMILALAATIGLTFTGHARAADLALSGPAVLELAASGQALCGGWRARDGSCEDVGFMDVLPENQVRQTYRFRLSLEPDVEIAMQEVVVLEGNALCSVFDFSNVDIRVLLDGAPAPDDQALAITMVLQQSMADYQGKKTCESFSRDSETGDLSTIVTVDGERDEDLETRYRLLTPEDRIHLREPDSGPDLMMMMV